MKVLALLSILISIHAEDIEITPLKTQILPFKLGNARVITTKHSFIHFVELAPLINQLGNIARFFQSINQSLARPAPSESNTIYRNAIKNLLKHTNHLIEISRNKVNNLVPHLRSKRGLLNIVGKTSKWLFGTLDSDDAVKYDTALKTLTQNQNSINNEIKLQTSLTKNLIENYNRTITTLDKNQRQIEIRLQYLQENDKLNFDNVITYILAQNTLEQIVLNCQNLISFIDNLEDAIMFAKLNTLHNSVISLSELQEIIKHLILIYGQNKIPKFQNLLTYYQIASLQVSFENNKVMFIIHFPILDSEIYEYFHVYPVPKNNLTLVPKLPFLILGTSYHQYQEDECTKMENMYLCHDHLQPAVEEDCTVAILREATAKSCCPVPVHMNSHVSEQISRQYILIVPAAQPIKIKKKCTSDGHLEIRDPSLVKIPPNCNLQVGHLFYTNREDLFEGEPFLLPEISIQEAPSSFDNTRPLRLNHVNLDDISMLRSQAENLGTQETIIPQVYLKTTQATLPLTIMCMATIVTIAGIYLRRRCSNPKKSTKKPTVPGAENNPSALFSDLRREELHM